METLFNSIQIYEPVSSVEFVVFSNHPDTLKSINESLNEAITKIKEHASVGCFTLTFCGLAILSSFNRILLFFCRHIDFKIETITETLTVLSTSIKETVDDVSVVMRSVFGDSIPGFERKKQWGPLEITERIRTKLSKFEQKSKIVERTVYSFENFFKSVETIQSYFEQCSNQCHTNQLIDIQINKIQQLTLEQVRETASLFQHIETILSYGVLIFQNEDDILNPLLDYVDESTKILDKFSSLHPLYKILIGKNYLSNLKSIIKKIIDLLKNSKLIINSPNEFLDELKQKYPNLIYILCESYINETLKKHLEFLPDSIKVAIDSACKIALSKLGDKLTNQEDVSTTLNETDSLYKYRQTIKLANGRRKLQPKKVYKKTEDNTLVIEDLKIIADYELAKKTVIINDIKTSSDESLNKEEVKLIKSEPINTHPISLKHFINMANFLPRDDNKSPVNSELSLEDSLEQPNSEVIPKAQIA